MMATKIASKAVNPLGPPQLIDGEDGRAYEDLHERVCLSVQPADILEEIWVRDLVDLTWEILRWRRLKSSLMAASAFKGLQKVLEPFSFEGYHDLVEDWAARKPDAIAQVNRMLETAGLTTDAVMALTACENLEAIRTMETMIAMAEHRRNEALCQIERHRVTLAHRARRTIQQLEDAEYQVVDAKVPQSKSAA
jgi:hypothetical protein